ncbi:hypothetical protein LZ554_005773 [Drepanopeziza brunnea f. sp. 'monogermtubi']|nr:hypothetical protein LZ554_005773 [Drepanopeziza brunnea f. sp. 'monogermtubi']
MESLPYRGSTSSFYRVDSENEVAIHFESKILHKLGSHPRIVPYLGPHIPSRGILLSQASHGTLQAQGVIHSDLKPENYLVHATADGSSLDLWLCDFGGSTCRELGHSIPHLPDDPFFDVRMPWIPTEAIDIFSLGSIIYTILTGHWPYREGTPPLNLDDIGVYETYVNDMITKGVSPDVSSLRAGKAIRGCWDHQYQTTEEVLGAMRLEFAALDKEDV